MNWKRIDVTDHLKLLYCYNIFNSTSPVFVSNIMVYFILRNIRNFHLTGKVVEIYEQSWCNILSIVTWLSCILVMSLIGWTHLQNNKMDRFLCFHWSLIMNDMSQVGQISSFPESCDTFSVLVFIFNISSNL